MSMQDEEIRILFEDWVKSRKKQDKPPEVLEELFEAFREGLLTGKTLRHVDDMWFNGKTLV